MNKHTQGLLGENAERWLEAQRRHAEQMSLIIDSSLSSTARAIECTINAFQETAQRNHRVIAEMENLAGGINIVDIQRKVSDAAMSELKTRADSLSLERQAMSKMVEPILLQMEHDRHALSCDIHKLAIESTMPVKSITDAQRTISGLADQITKSTRAFADQVNQVVRILNDSIRRINEPYLAASREALLRSTSMIKSFGDLQNGSSSTDLLQRCRNTELIALTEQAAKIGELILDTQRTLRTIATKEIDRQNSQMQALEQLFSPSSFEPVRQLLSEQMKAFEPIREFADKDWKQYIDQVLEQTGRGTD